MNSANNIMGYICQQDRKRKTNAFVWLLIQENTMKQTLCIVAFGAFGLGYIINSLQTAHALPNTSSIHLTSSPVRSSRMVAQFNQAIR